MPTFQCEVLAPNGQVDCELIEAVTPEHAAALLRERGVQVISVRPLKTWIFGEQPLPWICVPIASVIGAILPLIRGKALGVEEAKMPVVIVGFCLLLTLFMAMLVGISRVKDKLKQWACLIAGGIALALGTLGYLAAFYD